ncbi:hypothetical protein N7456_005097 [Penicillium angulare]|uniref:Uncharacterized protein n=1 Tax=Penicillium angulare TaxID=116970 RepID=A0A9W9KK86_9EURO|nr:hypothetical protein N7456_005097 [Penicillium angulare]
MEAHLTSDRRSVCDCSRCLITLEVLRFPGIIQSLGNLTTRQRQEILGDFRHQQERRVYEELRGSAFIPGFSNTWDQYHFVESRDVLLGIIHRFEAKIRSFSLEEALIVYRGWQLWGNTRIPPLSLSRFLFGVLAPYVSNSYFDGLEKFERTLDLAGYDIATRTQRVVRRVLQFDGFASWMHRASAYPHVMVHFGLDDIATLEYSEDGVNVLYDHPWGTQSTPQDEDLPISRIRIDQEPWEETVAQQEGGNIIQAKADTTLI